MCVDPISATAAVSAWAATNATAIAAASAVAAAGSVAYGAYSANQQARYQAKTADTNAVYSDREAKGAQLRGEDALRAHYRQVAALRGKQVAGMAASGLDLSFGSPGDVLAQTTILGNEDAGRIAANAEQEVQGFLIGGQNFRAEAAGQRAAGNQALIGGALNLAGTALTGASRVGDAASKYGFGKPKAPARRFSVEA